MPRAAASSTPTTTSRTSVTPTVAGRVAEQVQRLSTNTRYLSELHLDYAEALLARFPDEFDTCFLVNSGSEANEVAMRLATTFTGRQDMAVSEVGYHGITQKALDISHYKFAGKGGQGQADWVHVLPIPNTFSGPFTGADAPARYTAEAENPIAAIGQRGRARARRLPAGDLPQRWRAADPAAGLSAGLAARRSCRRRPADRRRSADRHGSVGAPLLGL